MSENKEREKMSRELSKTLNLGLKFLTNTDYRMQKSKTHNKPMIKSDYILSLNTAIRN